MPARLRPMVIALGLALAAPARGEEPPAPELLEFLGEFATGDGGWIDPALLAEEPPASPAAEAE